jgi:hypothetical protein
MLAVGRCLMRQTPHVAQQPSALPCGQRQHDRKDADSKHNFSSATSTGNKRASRRTFAGLRIRPIWNTDNQ